ncbi:hypothetical protein C0Q70_20689 [Pomacea canaliculata]|uniref:Uncharacterized protein n=1 Tax=Pomacea canaliculata TaxID=400727 RepID=A0A2T7NG89_POMCA|nr:hypothetical protein C0Q70_20689 [Pomacea canaliculata]
MLRLHALRGASSKVRANKRNSGPRRSANHHARRVIAPPPSPSYHTRPTPPLTITPPSRHTLKPPPFSSTRLCALSSPENPSANPFSPSEKTNTSNTFLTLPTPPPTKRAQSLSPDQAPGQRPAITRSPFLSPKHTRPPPTLLPPQPKAGAGGAPRRWVIKPTDLTMKEAAEARMPSKEAVVYRLSSCRPTVSDVIARDRPRAHRFHSRLTDESTAPVPDVILSLNTYTSTLGLADRCAEESAP